jgi:hypothetical protein
MSAKDRKNKKYEPPLVKEIGGTFEQAMGATQCATGGAFHAGDCTVGTGAQTGCSGGLADQACSGGASDQSGCNTGLAIGGGGCTAGWGN